MQLKGILKVYFWNKNFGFIYADCGEQFFVHNTGFINEPVLGGRVQFDVCPLKVVAGAKRQAINVRCEGGAQ
jgi:cold shock CspA family protein